MRCESLSMVLILDKLATRAPLHIVNVARAILRSNLQI